MLSAVKPASTQTRTSLFGWDNDDGLFRKSTGKTSYSPRIKYKLKLGLEWLAYFVLRAKKSPKPQCIYSFCSNVHFCVATAARLNAPEKVKELKREISPLNFIC
ncbi:hypothetical protein ATANTOWER_016694 [Ataeniobius toweri]|uniref:Uncharacterized protein n=1 Tax=Ataeniobius toweri TaxID=208326 RepID=A0ABU7AY87_9TELE|nr:hypothetical protein [Ataeniobius toweri]